jgi:hypothetical protein
MTLHRHWKVKLYGPIVLILAVGLALCPTLLPDVDLFFLGNWVAYPAAALGILIGVVLVREHQQPFVVHIDENGVQWDISGGRGAVPWRDVVRLGIERKPDEPPSKTPAQLMLWLRAPLGPDAKPDRELDGLVAYCLADVTELVESADEIRATVRRYEPAGIPPAPAFEAAAAPFGGAFADAFGGAFGASAAPAPAVLRPPADGECARCGGTPAVFHTVQSYYAVAVWGSMSTDRGWRCRDCALAAYRSRTVRTLRGCWFGLGVLALPVVLLSNAVRFRAAKRLTAPTPTPGVTAPERRPADPGRPVWLRPELPFAVVMAGLWVSLVVAFVAL